MNEWGFGGEIKSWWDAEIIAHPEWGLSRCSIEETSEGSRERADLTLFDDTDAPSLVLELRLPDHQNPSPYDMANVSNAAIKAQRLGASVVSQFSLVIRSRVTRPRRTFSMIWSAVAVQTNGLGSALWTARYSSMAATSSGTE